MGERGALTARTRPSLSYSCDMTRTSTHRLAEVAKKVGVSEATVSRVLNNKTGVSDSTREAVLTALDVLGYERPTQLRGERARLIGLVLPELQNPFFPARRAGCPRLTTWRCCLISTLQEWSSPAGTSLSWRLLMIITGCCTGAAS